MANKRIALTLRERLIIGKALAALKRTASLETSYVSDLGRGEIDRLSMKVTGGVSKPSEA